MPEFPFRLDHSVRSFMAGSCFTENIGLMMQQRGFDILMNPWGIQFNPLSIADMMEYVTGMKDQISIHPVKRDGFFVSLFQHSRIFGRTSEELQEMVLKTTIEARQYCQNASTFLLTLGTANVFVEKESGRVLANCHKQPSAMFQRKMLSVDEILNAWSKIIAANSNKRFIFTVSPVRHSRDGLVVNNLSKAILLLSVHQLCANFPEQCFYFPSYEIVMDELRDYRFFKEDLVHPNDMAIKYVWQKWEGAMYSNETISASEKYLKLVQQALHRPLFEETDNLVLRRDRLLIEVAALNEQCQNLDFKYLHHLLNQGEK